MKKLISCILLLAMCVMVFGACGTPKVSEELTAAKDFLYAMYKDEAIATPSDYNRTAVVSVGTVQYKVTWTAEVTSGDSEGVKIETAENNQVLVNVDEKAAADILYTLKATISDAEGKTIDITFDRKVPMFKELSWAEYVAAADGDTVIVKGVVTGIMAKSKGNSSNCLYLQDNDGGYYVYNMATDPAADDGIEVGMTVRVSGARATYSGTYEITEATVEILNNEKAEITAVDYTEKYKAATSLKDAALVAQQAMLVTLKGVEVTGEDESSGYYKFKLGTLESYVRISSSVCPITKDEQATFKAEHASHLGWTADVSGVICVYDGAFYLSPVSVDAFVYTGLPVKSDSEMVAFEKGNITFTGNVTQDGTFDLVTAGASYDKVSIAWTSDNACAVIDGGKVTFTLPEAETTVKLTATLTSGTATDTLELTVVVDAASTAQYIAEAVNEAKEGTYKFVIMQNSIGKVLYFDGTVNGSEYLATTEKAEKAADVTVTAAEGGYTLKVGEKFLEVYNNAAGKTRPTLSDKSNGVWVWDNDAKVFTFTLGEKTYYLGTYNTYDTFSASEMKYITGENAAKVDVSQFPGRLITRGFAE